MRARNPNTKYPLEKMNYVFSILKTILLIQILSVCKNTHKFAVGTFRHESPDNYKKYFQEN